MVSNRKVHPSAAGSPDAACALELVRKTRELQALFEISKTLSSALDLNTMLDAVVERLAGIIDAAESAAVLLFSHEAGILEVASSFGYQGDWLRQIRLQPGESLAGKVFQTGRIQLFATPRETAEAMATMRTENRILFEKAAGREGPPNSAVCAPLLSRGERLGVLVLQELRNGEQFIQSDLEFVQALADLVAMAVERERLLKEAEQSRVLQEANRLKSELLSTLSHEMRTPLASIKGYATALLMEEGGWDEETRREFLRIIDGESDNLRELITDILESSTIEAGLLRIEKQPCLAARLAERAVEQASLRTHRHRFLASFPPGFPVVDADPRRIEQVLHNLLDNAVKYSPEGGLIAIRGEPRPGEVEISVADQGVGIAPEHLNRLFERFFRIKSGIGPNVVGTGLGLPIARTIVESHGGRIWAESAVGSGTTLFFTLPREPRREDEEDDA
ncbi:MAG: GAF domain-containing sensor histidine kinase [Chloroflexota bacterium]